jgi:glycosyltransferase involved in cell wall biosynthesis
MKICFWGDIASAINGNTNGGGQLQIMLLAKALALAGHEVVILDHEIGKEFKTDEGIKVLPIKGWNEGIRMIRTFTGRLPRLYADLKKQRADIYYCRIRDFRHILAYWAARKVGGKFVLGLASDLDIMNLNTRWEYTYKSHLQSLWDLVNGILSEIVYPFLLKRADLVLIQHEGQKQKLLKKNVRFKILYNLIEISPPQAIIDHNHEDFIYVGSLDKRKGFVEFLEIVKRSPFCSFKIIGQPRDKTGYLLYEEFRSFKNVKLFGRLPHSETLQHIANSKALISTSPWEGFPNIFIESWACGVPVLSLHVDPGGVIETENLGFFAHGDFNRMISAMKNTRYSKGFTEKAVTYVKNKHLLDKDKIFEIGKIFKELSDS